MKKGFTLIELLIAVGIIATLAIVVILVINPAALLQQARDGNRLSDMRTLNDAISLYYQDAISSPSTLFMGTSSILYISVPDPTATSTAGNQCTGLSLSAPPTGYTYHCASAATYTKTDGTGWVPIDFNSYSAGSVVSQLPVDPVNTTSTDLYYSYETDGVGGYKLAALFESNKYAPLAISDDGSDPALYEAGTNLTLVSTREMGVSNPSPTLASISPNATTTGGGAFTLMANGSSFVSGATINWNGTPLSTTYVSASELTATVPSTDIAISGTNVVTVTNPTPGGGTSGSATFTVTSGSGYAYDRAITVGANASGTQANFPMLVSSTVSSWASVANGGHVQNLTTAPNGGQEPADVIFTSDSGCTTPLNFETESYSSSTGALVDWVNVPSLSAGSVIYVCYGNSSVTTDQSNPASTWNSNYLGVWHFPSVNGVLKANDSTARAHNGTVTGATATTTQIDGGAYFPSTSNNISIGVSNLYSLTTSSTQQIWLKISANTSGRVFSFINGASTKMALNIGTTPGGGTNNNGQIYAFYVNTSNTQAALNYPVSLNDGNWHYLAFTINGTSGILYVDGSAVTSTNVVSSTATFAFGTGNAGFGDILAATMPTPKMDEGRLAATALTPSWILTEYNNQVNPSTFYSIGSEL